MSKSLYWGSSEQLGLAHAFWYSTPWRSVCGVLTTENGGLAASPSGKHRCTPCAEFMDLEGLRCSSLLTGSTSSSSS